MPSTTPLWSPRQTLSIPPSTRCVGTAHTARRQCKNPIAGCNLSASDDLLDAIALQEPDADALQPQLEELAGYLLCKRWHRGTQVRQVVDEWRGRMAGVVVVGEEAVGDAGVTESARLSATASVSSAAGSSSRNATPMTLRAASPRSSASSRSSELAEMQAILQEILGRFEWAESTQSSAASSASSASSVAFSSRRSTPATSRSSSPGISASSSRRIGIPASSSRTCTRTHVRRRAIDDECPICYDTFLVRDQDRLVWCKSGCGRTVHQTCFETWKAACEQSDRSVTCAMCRTVWADDCGCE